jgi:hypothetical protein
MMDVHACRQEELGGLNAEADVPCSTPLRNSSATYGLDQTHFSTDLVMRVRPTRTISNFLIINLVFRGDNKLSKFYIYKI